MWLYLIILFIPILFYVLIGDSAQKKNSVLLFIYLFFLAFFVGMSDMLGGYDRYIYGEVFDRIADVTTNGGDFSATRNSFIFKGEWGYYLLNVLISQYTANRYIFILSITILIYTLLFVDLKRYASNYPFALILFMGLWFFFSFTYLRQVLAATVVWLGVRYIAERKLLKFLIVCAIGYSLHNSALIFLPMYFVPIRRFDTEKVLIVMGITLILGLSPIPNALFNAYDEVSEYERNNAVDASSAFRIEYFLEATFFLFIILTNYRNITPTRMNIVLLNMAIVFCGVLLFFIRSDNGGRLSWYYMIGLIATLTNICSSRTIKAYVPVLMIVLCFGLYIRIYTSWNANMYLYPYKTFMTNGYRNGDACWQNYEYAHNYDYNKLYRPAFR